MAQVAKRLSAVWPSESQPALKLLRQRPISRTEAMKESLPNKRKGPGLSSETSPKLRSTYAVPLKLHLSPDGERRCLKGSPFHNSVAERRPGAGGLTARQRADLHGFRGKPFTLERHGTATTPSYIEEWKGARARRRGGSPQGLATSGHISRRNQGLSLGKGCA